MKTTSSIVVAASVAVPLILASPAVANNGQTVSSRALKSSTLVRFNNDTVLPVVSQTVGQTYYWTDEWQTQETSAMRDLRNRDYKDFVSSEDAIAWLLDGEA